MIVVVSDFFGDVRKHFFTVLRRNHVRQTPAAFGLSVGGPT
jgi:hypothetical protein